MTPRADRDLGILGISPHPLPAASTALRPAAIIPGTVPAIAGETARPAAAQIVLQPFQELPGHAAGVRLAGP